MTTVTTEAAAAVVVAAAIANGHDEYEQARSPIFIRFYIISPSNKYIKLELNEIVVAFVRATDEFIDYIDDVYV